MNIRDSTRDTRGILDPALFRQRVELTRYPPPTPLEGVVERFWCVQWELPDGVVHEQQLLTHPAANVSVGPADGHDETGPIEARVYGVARRLSSRRMPGRGWTVAAMTTVGGIGALIDAPARDHTDRVHTFDDAFGVAGADLADAITAAGDEASRVGMLQDALVHALRPAKVSAAREVAAAARLAETDRGVVRLGDLAERTGLSPRTLQRMFRDYAGVSPTWVLRRYRLIDAAEAVRSGTSVDWASLALELGYADQAHLIRDFRASIGQTPAAYARAQRPVSG